MVAPQHVDRGKLSGLRRRMVMRDLALGEMTQTQIAEKYGVVPSSITEFKQRHADQIAAIQAHAEDEFAGMLITQKAARLAALEEILEKSLAPTPKISVKGDVVQRINPETGQREEIMEIDARAAMQALKQAAEEMGQLPTRIQMTGDMQTTTTYRIEGVDPKDLR